MLPQRRERKDHRIVPDYGGHRSHDFLLRKLCVFSSLHAEIFTYQLLLDGVSENPSIKSTPSAWKVPFGIQLIPAGIMALGLMTIRVSPRMQSLILHIADIVTGISSFPRQCGQD